MPIDAPTYARWEVFASAFGVGVVVLGALCNLIVNQLPSRKLQALCETLDETQSFLGDCVEEGILREGHIRAFQKRLSYLRTRTNEVRSCVHAASTWSEDFSNWAGGYTTMIKRLIGDVKKVRYSISTTSREERAKAEASRRAPDHSDSGSDDAQVSAVLETPETISSKSTWRLLCCFRRTPRRLPVRDYPPLPDDTGPGTFPDNAHPDGPGTYEANGAPCHHPSPPPSLDSACLSRPGDPGMHAPDRAGRARLRSSSGTIPSRSAQHKRKLMGKLRLGRGRACAHPNPARHKRRSRADSEGDCILLSSTTISSIELLETDDDEWEDVLTQKAQVVQ